MESTAALRGATVVLGDRPVLHDVDLEVVPGLTVLRGPNGAGKTTAIRALAGLVPLAQGTRQAPAANDVLYLGHRSQLLQGLTPRENLAFFRSFRGLTSRAVSRLRTGDAPFTRPYDPVDDALATWGLGSDADRAVEQLSAGQRRRAALARTAIESCVLTLFDEPFAELDADAVALLTTTLTELAVMGASVVVASHGHSEIDEIAVRVVTLADGRLVGSA